MRIEVVRAWRGGHCARVVDLHEGATLGEAVVASGIDTRGVAGHAVHGERAAPGRVLREGDRVELLEALQADPKQARRARAGAGKRRDPG